MWSVGVPGGIPAAGPDGCPSVCFSSALIVFSEGLSVALKRMKAESLGAALLPLSQALKLEDVMLVNSRERSGLCRESPVDSHEAGSCEERTIQSLVWHELSLPCFSPPSCQASILGVQQPCLGPHIG